MQKQCIICKTKFNTVLKQKKCCSTECSERYKKIHDREYFESKHIKYEKKCIVCNKLFSTYKSYKTTCNKICAKINKKNKVKLYGQKRYIKYEKKCIVCNKLFSTYKKHKKLCSKECFLIHSKLTTKQRCQNRYINDNLYRIKVLLSSGIRNNIKNKNYIKQDKIYNLIGCDYDTYIKYIEDKFKPGMTWENHNFYTWHIDHIKPISSFDLSKVEEQKKAFHYTNTQPLWWWENLKKGSKY